MSPVKFLSIVLLVVCGALAACSTPGRSYTESTMQETLEIEILPNTSKMFVYRLRWPEDEMPNLVRIERDSGPRQEYQRGGVNLGRNTQLRLSENAAYVVKRMGYCQNGFLEIDSSSSRYHLWLKGECKDGATDADRKQFGEKQILPVKFNR
jgi:hypothetical protein